MGKIPVVQILRALAALAVAFGHAENEALGLARESGVGFHTFLIELTGAGVDLFFVISGFVMVHSSRRLFAAPGGPKAFLARRIARIVPLYWTATTLFLLVLWVVPSTLHGGATGPSEIIKSFLFIPYWRPEEHLLQPVYKLGWTLNYEMFFYAVFAVAILLPMRRAVLAISGFFCAAVAAGFLCHPAPGALQFWSDPIILEFVAGAWLGWLSVSGWHMGRGAASAVLSLGIAALLGISLFVPGASDFSARLLTQGVPSVLILAGVALREPPLPARSAPTRFLVRLGDASYALYLSHPILIRSLHLALNDTGLRRALGGWTYVSLTMLLVALSSIAIYEWFERPVTSWCQRALGVASSRSMREPQPAV